MSDPAISHRSRLRLGMLAGFTIALGLASRRFPEQLPTFVAEFAGDTLWASLMFWIVAWLRPKATAFAVGATALTISVLVELSQLVHEPWLDVVRANAVGALVLGQGFVWSDLLCYTVGVVLAFVLDRINWVE